MNTDKTCEKAPTDPPGASYRSRTGLSWKEIVLFVIAILVCGLAKVMGVEYETEVNLALGLVVAVASFASVVCLAAYRLVFRAHLHVFRSGVLVESRWAKTFTRWEDIEAILEFEPPDERNWLGIEVPNYRCGFSRIDGKTFWFYISRVSDLRDFAAQLHKRADDLIRARTLRALAAGEVVWFGLIGIGRDGVHSRKGVLPWTEVSFAGCVHGKDFDVLKKGTSWTWFSRRICEVENVAILTELMRTWKAWASPA